MESEQDKNSKLRSQIESLRSGNHSAIHATLKELRSQGSVSILPELIDVMVDQENAEIQSAVSSLLNDLKDQECAGILAEAIGNPEFKRIQAPLVAACWQNGLSYGKYLGVFADVVLQGEYEAAIEAFTVIEEAIGELEEKQRDGLVKKLKANLPETDDQKKPLLIELIKVISSY